VRALAAAVVLVATAVQAHADDQTHVALTAGGALHVNGGHPGAWGAIELWPGGPWGARADVLWFDAGPLFLEASITRQLAGSRPHLLVYLHFGAGVDANDFALVGSGGLTTQIGLGLGPLAIGLDVSVHVAAWSGRFDASFVGSLAAVAVW
jgi:hypothetical protein